MKMKWTIAVTVILLIGLLGMIVTLGVRSESKSEVTEGDPSMFVRIEEGAYWDVYYHQETKVMYVMSLSSYNRGNFTVMVDQDGSPMLYENTKED